MKKLETVVFFIEANSYERLALWNKYHEKIPWEDDNSGFSVWVGNIGKKKKREVWVEFFFAKIFSKRICFYNATSRFVDHTMVKDWIKENWDNNSRIAITDAMNFHHVIDACNEENIPINMIDDNEKSHKKSNLKLKIDHKDELPEWFETEQIASVGGDNKKRKLLVSHQWGADREGLIDQLNLLIEGLKTNFENFAS